MEKINKNNALINKLISQTRDKKLIWTITSKPDKYVLFLQQNQIIVECSNKIIGRPIYEFVIVDMFGNIIEKLTFNPIGAEQSFSIIKNLFNEVKCSVDSKIGSAIDSIISELG